MIIRSVTDSSNRAVPPLEFKQGSLFRRIRELVYRVFCNIWRSGASYFQKIKTDNKPDSPGGFELLRKRCLGPSAIQEVTGKLNNVQLVNNFMFENLGSELPEREKELARVSHQHSSRFGDTDAQSGRMVGEKSGLVFIPTVLQGRPDHIVTIVFDAEKSRIELYDPKGLTANDHSENVRGQDFRLVDLIEKVADKYGATTLWENTALHQKDSHNCGVYALDYISRRSSNEQPEDIAKKGLSFSKANNERRAEFLAWIHGQKPSSQ